MGARAGLSTFGFQWASASKITVDTKKGAFETTNLLNFLKLFYIKNVDINNVTLERTQNKLRRLEIRPDHEYSDTNSVLDKYGILWNAQWERDYYRTKVCSDELVVPPLHKVEVDFTFNGLGLVVDVLVDLKLRLCEEFLNEIDELKDKKYVYLFGVPARIDHFEPLSCNTIFYPSKFVPNEKQKCYERVQLGIVSRRDYLPQCKKDDKSKYEGCQYDKSKGRAWCVDSYFGNPIKGELALLGDNDYRKVCVETLQCANSSYVWTQSPTQSPTTAAPTTI